MKKALLPKIERVSEREALLIISRVLEETPRVSVDWIKSDTLDGCDFLVGITTPLGQQILACEVKARAYPNEVVSISARLKRVVQGHGNANWYPVLIAPYFSKPTLQTCSELGLSCVDFAGNCQISTPGMYIKIAGRANRFHRGRDTLSLYSPKSAQVVHTLLANPKREWKIQELVSESHTSLGLVSNVKSKLERNLWIKSSFGKTLLMEPRKLIEDWLLNYKPNRTTRHFFSLDGPSQIEQRLVDLEHDYALTEFSAADKYAPHTRYQRVAFYVRTWDDTIPEFLGLKDGEGASNITIYESQSAFIQKEIVQKLVCTSPILTYLDLASVPGRGQDAAEHLLEYCILPRWQ